MSSFKFSPVIRPAFTVQSSTGKKCQVLQTTRNLAENQKNVIIVIAVVANVAAFDLCGSSQHVGTEVKSS